MAEINIVKELSEQEKKFKDKFPEIFKKYLLYVSFYSIKTGKNINTQKDYDTIIVKSLISYFIYQEQKYNKRLTLSYIADLLNYKDHTGVLYAIKRIQLLLRTQPKYKVNDRYIRDYFLIFNCIFCKSKNKKIKNKYT